MRHVIIHPPDLHLSHFFLRMSEQYINIECRLNIFDRVVLNILLYRIPVQFCKMILHLKQPTPTCSCIVIYRITQISTPSCIVIYRITQISTPSCIVIYRITQISTPSCIVIYRITQISTPSCIVIYMI